LGFIAANKKKCQTQKKDPQKNCSRTKAEGKILHLQFPALDSYRHLGLHRKSYRSPLHRTSTSIQQDERYFAAGQKSLQVKFVTNRIKCQIVLEM
ncbi:MAG: hypothetical protein ACYS14_09220, partial [Planctomycetota bacterium]